MPLIADMHNSGLPIDVRKLQEQHLLATQARVDIQNDELRPVVKMIPALISIVFSALN